jgi:hypothetical protein
MVAIRAGEVVGVLSIPNVGLYPGNLAYRMAAKSGESGKQAFDALRSALPPELAARLDAAVEKGRARQPLKEG